jgi:hypothetical protein
MGGIAKICLGNLFDGPSDLIVLPCSTIGTVTGFVARSLAHYSIPHPCDRMEHGEVEIMPFEDGENIAQFVAFAASVLAPGTSTPEAIRSIGRTLGEFTTKQPSVRVIAAPLLGAGAGGLQSEKVVASLREGFLSSADSGASLVVHVLQQDVFNRLRGNRTKLKGSPSLPLRVAAEVLALPALLSVAKDGGTQAMREEVANRFGRIRGHRTLGFGPGFVLGQHDPPSDLGVGPIAEVGGRWRGSQPWGLFNPFNPCQQRPGAPV